MNGYYDNKDYGSLSEKVYRFLRDGIAEGRYQTGDCLVEMKIAEELGVSRTPVREAMKLLCHEGLLTAQPRRGMSVTRLTPAQVAEAQQLCNLLANHLEKLQPQPSAHSTGLTRQLYGVAQARLQLARGPDASLPLNFSAPQTAPAQPALAD